MRLARQITGWVALGAYLGMGALLYFVIIPGAGGHFPPDFRLLGYDGESIVPFFGALTDSARETYMVLLTRWDRVFIVSLACWLGLMGWRGSGLRYVVAGLAVVYALIDMGENALILRLLNELVLDPVVVSAAASLTMAKFASLYLTVLVLIWHLRRYPT